MPLLNHDRAGDALRKAEAEIVRLKREVERLKRRPDVAPEVASFALELERRTGFTRKFPSANAALDVFAGAVDEHFGSGGIQPGESVEAWRARQVG